jgi:CTP synthase (UTP-ammonia lyase)
VFGSCGGFQHMLIELARDAAGLASADTAETNPGGTELVIAPLACSLVEQTGPLRFSPGSRLRAIYGRDTATEGYHCRYGLNAAYRARLAATGLQFTAFDENGEVRGAELPASTHPFFIGTLFQPERAALRGETPPLARALVRAAAQFTP